MNGIKLLIIADDLTGGADAGVQFAKRGFNTILLSLQSKSFLDLNQYRHKQIIVVNTGSRNLSPHEARSAITILFRACRDFSFPFIYKKIDSTLRGNIGPEIDALLDETRTPLAFIAPSFPELQRTVVGGMMTVRGKPLALTEASCDVASPVTESYVHKLLQAQTEHLVGWIDLTHIAAGGQLLLSTVQAEQSKGSRIVTFDAVTKEDLKKIADLAFSMNPKPMLIGSAGLASEISSRLVAYLPRTDDLPAQSTEKSIPRRTLIISGSPSSITREQLKYAESRGIATIELPPSIVFMPVSKQAQLINTITAKATGCFENDHLILKSFEMSSTRQPRNALPISGEITRILGRIARGILDGIHAKKEDIVLALTGGDTAMSVLSALRINALEINDEILDGISLCSVAGGRWYGLKVFTKAGAFGDENALVKIIEHGT